MAALSGISQGAERQTRVIVTQGSSVLVAAAWQGIRHKPWGDFGLLPSGGFWSLCFLSGLISVLTHPFLKSPCSSPWWNVMFCRVGDEQGQNKPQLPQGLLVHLRFHLLDKPQRSSTPGCCVSLSVSQDKIVITRAAAGGNSLRCTKDTCGLKAPISRVNPDLMEHKVTYPWLSLQKMPNFMATFQNMRIIFFPMGEM